MERFFFSNYRFNMSPQISCFFLCQLWWTIFLGKLSNSSKFLNLMTYFSYILYNACKIYSKVTFFKILISIFLTSLFFIHLVMKLIILLVSIPWILIVCTLLFSSKYFNFYCFSLCIMTYRNSLSKIQTSMGFFSTFLLLNVSLILLNSNKIFIMIFILCIVLRLTLQSQIWQILVQIQFIV